MNTFFRNLFTRRVFNIIVGVCALIWVIILTWGLIELALKGSVEEDGWRARLSSYSSNDDYDAEDYKTLSTDTVYGAILKMHWWCRCLRWTIRENMSLILF